MSKKNIECLENNKKSCSEDCKEGQNEKITKKIKKTEEKEHKIKREIEEEEEADETNEEKKEEKNDKDKNKKNIIFKDHYHKHGNNIYWYKPKIIKKSSIRCTLYCSEAHKQSCNAKCVVFTNSNIISFSGNHNHCGISKNNFYKIYPFLENTEWEDIQVIVENGKNVLKLQR